MDYPTSASRNINDIINVEFTDIIPAKRGLLDMFLSRSDASLREQMQQDAELASFRRQLTEFALAGVGAASVMEQHISSIAPHAAARCRAIVDASTVRAIEQIGRW